MSNKTLFWIIMFIIGVAIISLLIHAHAYAQVYSYGDMIRDLTETREEFYKQPVLKQDWDYLRTQENIIKRQYKFSEQQRLEDLTNDIYKSSEIYDPADSIYNPNDF